MTPKQTTILIKNVLAKGWVFDGTTYWPPGSKEAQQINAKATTRKARTVHGKTGWIDDTRNIANKVKSTDAFIKLIQQELKLDVWPEFYFLTDRVFRFDYAIPLNQHGEAVKIAIEIEGGIWAKGNSGHSSGKGILRDMEKGSLANVNGWTLIRRTPDQQLTNDTLLLIEQASRLKKI